MDFRDLARLQHARAHAASTANAEISTQDNMLRDASEEQIRSRPRPGFNSMAWLLWHITRGEDAAANLVLSDGTQVLDDGWHEKLGVERRDFGASMPDDEVDAFNEAINVPALLGYRDAVGRRTQELIRSLDTAVLDQPIDATILERLRNEGFVTERSSWLLDRWSTKTKDYVLAHTILAHSFVHLGQGDINRSLFGLETS